MSDISHIQVESTTYDICDINAREHNTFYVKGTQSSSTGAWTGNLPDVSSLYEGLTIDYWLPFNGSGNATLNLTLKDGSTTGPIDCYYSGTSRLTTHIPANNICRMVYQTVTISNVNITGWWVTRAYDTNTQPNIVLENSMLYFKGSILANSIVGGDKNGFETLTSGSTFDISYPVMWAKNAYNASSQGYQGFYHLCYDLDPTSYIEVTDASCARKALYIVGTLNGTSFTIVGSPSSAGCAFAPTEDNNYAYYCIGHLESNTTSGKYYLQFNTLGRDIFVHRNGKFQRLDYAADTGLSSKSDLASDAYHTYYVAGTQTAATNVWTGNLPQVSALYEGLAIDYWLPFAGTNTAATLNLTLKDGSQTGALPIYIGGTTKATTHIPATTLARLVYRVANISGVDTPSWWTIRSYDTNTTDIVNLYEGTPYRQADSVVYRYQLLFDTPSGTLTPLNNASNNTNTNKTMLTNVAFDPFGKIYFYSSTTTVNAGANMGTALYYHRNGIDMRYTFNCGQTLTANADIWLKVVPQLDGMVKLSADPCWVQSLPNTNDGYWYIFLGRTYSAYQFTLFTEHPVYYHNGTELRKIENIQEASALSSGLMSAADKTKLNGIEQNANAYELPTASSSVKGGVKIGSGITLSADGTISVSGGGGGAIPIASDTTLGGIKVGANLSIDPDTGVLSATDTTYQTATTSRNGLMTSSQVSTLNSAYTKASDSWNAINTMTTIVNRPDYVISTTDLEDGVSSLDAGKLYFYYEV